MRWQSTRVLITGAGGFIGGNLTRRLLDQGAEVRAMVRESTDLWRLGEVADRIDLPIGDVTDAAALERATNRETDVIFNLATTRAEATAADRQEALATNVVGTLNVLEAGARCGAAVVHLGSSLEQGREGLPPASFFAATKSAATLLCTQRAASAGQQVLVVRPSLVYGPWQSPDRLLPKLIDAVERDADAVLTVPGLRRDWIYVDDVVDLCLLAASPAAEGGAVLDAATGERPANEDVAAVVAEAAGRPLSVRAGDHPARAWDSPEWPEVGGEGAARLGWRPRHDLRAGVARSLAWHRERRGVTPVGAS